MDRVVRIIGVGIVVAAVALAVGYYRQTETAITAGRADDVVLAADGGAAPGTPMMQSEVADPAGSAGMIPRYLAFNPGIRSGLYGIADLASSRDRDVTPSARTRDLSYPIETDLVPDHSLAGPGLLEPGLYATAFGVEDCSYQLRQVLSDDRDAVIGQDRLHEGRMLVTINEIEPDTFSAVPQCGRWAPWSPLVEPLSVAPNGDYWIGDLAIGTWQVPEGCLWEKVVGFRGAKLWDVQDSAAGPIALVVDEETLGIRVRGCDQPLRHHSLLPVAEPGLLADPPGR